MKKLLLGLFAAVGVFATTFFVGSVARSAQPETWDEISLPASVVLDDTLELPAVNMTVGGKRYEAKTKLVYPDKTAVVRTADYTEAKLSVAGVYTLSFEAKDDGGARYIKKETFLVADKLFKVTDQKSSVYYGHDDLAEEGVNGLMVKMTRKDTLTFGKIIDLTDIIKDTVLVSGFITPSKQGSYDFDRLVFTFTDVYNPECTLSFQGRRSLSPDVHANGISYWMAWGNGQKGSGYEGSIFHHGDVWGTPYVHSFLAMSTGRGDPLTSYPQPSNTNEFKLRFDPREVKAYVADNYITDLDDPFLHDGENIWSGFTSGKVRLSVNVYDVAGETAEFCLTSVLGYDLAGENTFVEADAPVITVEDKDGITDENGNCLPLAVVGGSYPVLSATAFDEYSGETAVKTAVYYNYADAQSRTTCVIENGRFSVHNIGKYTVVYTAMDRNGNAAIKLLRITAVGKLDKSLFVSVNPTVTSGVCGEKIFAAEPVTDGGSGTIAVKAWAELGDEKIEIENGAFLPESAGEWIVHYVATDITALTAETSYKVTVSAGDKPILPEKLGLPEYFISGMKYLVPEIYATDYTTGVKKQVLATLSVTDKNGTKEYNAGETYAPEVTSYGDEVVLTVKAGNASAEKRVKTIVSVENGLLKMEELFFGDGFDTEKTDNGLILTATENGNVLWTFANSVAAKNAGVTIAGVKGKDDFGSLKITFRDSVDETIAITVKIDNVKGKNAHISFGNADRDISQGFALSDNVFEITFDGTNVKIGRLSVVVDKTDGGEAFNGFPSGKAYISAEMTNAKAGAGYIIRKIDNNPITKLSIDRIKPRIAVNGDYGGMYDIGDEYTIVSAIATDTLSPYVTLSVTARTPSGQIVKDVNGVEILGVSADRSYSFAITESGQYKVVYSAADQAGNVGSLEYGINILDKVAPMVKVAKTTKTAKVGDKITLPKVDVTDNVSTADKIIVYRTVRCPDGRLNVIGTGSETYGDEITKINYTYTFRYAGEYRFMVLAIDEAGNQTLAEYTVIVE